MATEAYQGHYQATSEYLMTKSSSSVIINMQNVFVCMCFYNAPFLIIISLIIGFFSSVKLLIIGQMLVLHNFEPFIDFELSVFQL